MSTRIPKVWWMTLTALMTAAVVTGACSGSDDSNEAANPEAISLVDGKALYEKSCASCHGSDLRGTDRGPSHLSVVYEPGHHSDESFRSAVANGVVAHHWQFGNMEPVTGLSNEQVTEIIRFIREQQRKEGFEPYPPE